MYRWQTLTLARVEAQVGPIRPLLDGCLDALVAINLRHFPEPVIEPTGERDAPTIHLSWHVDERRMKIAVSPDGGVGVVSGPVSDWRAGRPDNLAPLDRGKLPAIVAFLLGVGMVPPAAGKAAPAKAFVSAHDGPVPIGPHQILPPRVTGPTAGR